jgi:hypothetical protein
MTPALKATLRALGLTSREFGRITGKSEDALSSWGKKRPEPAWPRRLVRAWQMCPEALEDARATPSEEP